MRGAVSLGQALTNLPRARIWRGPAARAHGCGTSLLLEAPRGVGSLMLADGFPAR